MELRDITPENFFAFITFMSDPVPAEKLKIPDGEFLTCAIMFQLISKLEELRLSSIR
jgi:hypothetical protein